MLPGSVVEIRGDQVSLETTFAAGCLYSIVSSEPAFLGNEPKDDETREASEMIMLVGRGPVRVSGAAPANAFLVPSGKSDGTARAVAPEEMTTELERQCFGVVMGGGSEGGEGDETTVWAFVSARPFFGQVARDPSGRCSCSCGAASRRGSSCATTSSRASRWRRRRT